jgi:hypothetical protein
MSFIVNSGFRRFLQSLAEQDAPRLLEEAAAGSG